MAEKNLTFKIKGFVAPADVPSWSRRPPKWSELMELIRNLEPGQTIVIEFPNKDVANRARNVVRDELNSDIGRAAVRTRLVRREVVNGDGGAEVYFTRLHPVDIIEADK